MQTGALPICAVTLAGGLLCFGPGAGAQELSVELETVVSGLDRPVSIAHAGDERLFVVEQAGFVRIVRHGTLYPQPFLDLSGIVTPCDPNCGEQGLLGLAFHPDYAANGWFYVNYTDLSGDTVIARYQVFEANPDLADPASAQILLTVDQPFANHNGGGLAFGPDGYLYISLGDGGGGGDPGENAQDLTTLLGKLLRIDVNADDFPADANRNYAIPAANPFVGVAGRDEIWAYGLRNPWRFSFDRAGGDLWIADVGQGMWEEVNFQAAGDSGGHNYGWDVLEGTHCFEDDPGGQGSCNAFQTGGSTLPVLEYSSSGTGHCSVTGGYRYRGSLEPQLRGVYLYADFCSGQIWGSLPNCSGAVESRPLEVTAVNVTTFGEDSKGEVYLAGFESGDDTLYRVVVAPASGGPALSPSPNPVDYGTRSVGAVVTRAVDISHTGTGADAVVMEALALSDTDHFSVDLSAGAQPCGAAPVCLPPGTHCTLSVTFAPQREGGFDERLWFLANSPPAPVSLHAIVPCTGPDTLALSNDTISTQQFFTACQSISAGPDWTVGASGDVELRAGASVVLQPGFAVAQGGEFRVAVDPVLAP